MIFCKTTLAAFLRSESLVQWLAFCPQCLFNTVMYRSEYVLKYRSLVPPESRREASDGWLIFCKTSPNPNRKAIAAVMNNPKKTLDFLTGFLSLSQSS